MLKIRLMRIGSRKKPFYRLVAVDERSKRTGGYLELLGTYNPLTEPKDIKLKQDRINYWVKQGAQPSTGYLRIIGKAPQRPPRKPKKAAKETQEPTEQTKQETPAKELPVTEAEKPQEEATAAETEEAKEEKQPQETQADASAENKQPEGDQQAPQETEEAKPKEPAAEKSKDQDE